MKNFSIKLIKFLVLSKAAPSRRDAQKLLIEDRVTVNDQKVHQPSMEVIPDKDKICVDGKLITKKPEDFIYIMLNKPENTICSHADEKGRKTVYELIKRRDIKNKGLFTAGRLDFKTTGLLFLTNDGYFAQVLTHPRYEVLKHYIAKIKGEITDSILKKMTDGVFIDNERLKFEKVIVIKKTPKRAVLRIILNEGKNREIRRMFMFFKLTIKSLHRVQIGPFVLPDNLNYGSFKLLKKRQIYDFLNKFEIKRNH